MSLLKDIKEKKIRNVKFWELMNEYPRLKTILIEKLDTDIADLKDELAHGEVLSIEAIRLIQGQIKALENMRSVVLRGI